MCNRKRELTWVSVQPTGNSTLGSENAMKFRESNKANATWVQLPECSRTRRDFGQ
jgi:hypothetical protein